MNLSRETILLGDIVNYSVKGLTAALGKGEGITKSLRSISFKVNDKSSFMDLGDAVISTNLLETGDIIVIPSKVLSLLEKRFVYGLTIENYNQCISDMNFARSNLKLLDDDPLTEKDQIGLDKINPEKKIGVRYPKNPNFSCYKIAKYIYKKSAKKIDVVICDSDSGGKKGVKLIGCPTIINTPIGATKGLRLFYCMRVAAAAEITWNNIKNTPILLVQPYQASRLRKDVGELRYEGFINAKKETDFISIIEGK